MERFFICCFKDLALTSGIIKAMLSGPGQYAENESNEVNFREIPWVLCLDYKVSYWDFKEINLFEVKTFVPTSLQVEIAPSVVLN